MKRGFLSAGVLFLVLVGLLGALAVGYGLWSKTLSVSGTVNTGDFNADWDYAWTDDTGDDPGYTKDVASCEVTGVGSQDLVVTIDNAYPSYTCTITAAITNTGTVPFNVMVGAFSADPELDVDCDFTPGQVDKDGELEGTCTVHVNQDAKERQTYTASATLCVAQWNESPSLAECLAAAGQSEP